MNVDELYQKHKEKHDAVAQHIKDLAKKHNVSRSMVRLQSLLVNKMYEYDQEMPESHTADYYRFGNVRENFIFANRIKRHICHV